MIKNIAVLLILFGAVYGRQIDIRIDGSSIDPYILEDVINSTIEGLRPDIPEKIELDDFPLDFPDSEDAILSGSADLSNFELTGVKEFELQYLNLAIIGTRLNFTLVLPSINLNTDYKGDLELLHLIPLYGDGKANIHINDLEIQGSAQADLSNGVAVKNLVIQLYIGSATFDIHGALDNEDFSQILSAVLTDAVTTLVDNHQEAITNIISPLLEAVINAILANTDTNTTVPSV